LLAVPNLPHESVPVGADEHGNVVVRTWGTPKSFDFEIKDHVDMGTPLGLDFEMGVKLTGARFTVMKGPMARLHRALAQFMLDVQTQEHGYTECYTPYMSMATRCAAPASCPSSRATCLPPKRAGKKVKSNPTTPALYLIPTSEVPLTNFVRDVVVAESDCPSSSPHTRPVFVRRRAAPGATPEA
jgi:seryl-tRNA synthetase